MIPLLFSHNFQLPLSHHTVALWSHEYQHLSFSGWYGQSGHWTQDLFLMEIPTGFWNICSNSKEVLALISAFFYNLFGIWCIRHFLYSSLPARIRLKSNTATSGSFAILIATSGREDQRLSGLFFITVHASLNGPSVENLSNCKVFL